MIIKYISNKSATQSMSGNQIIVGHFACWLDTISGPIKLWSDKVIHEATLICFAINIGFQMGKYQ